MLTAETKRTIDAARDVLVGKVPDPKAQVEQITTALIYKFMHDLDQESVALGGQAKYFSGDYQKFAWSSLLDTRLSGEARLDLYVQAVTSLERNPNLPQLFRDIFKGAFLPYNDPQTLTLFLKEINKFRYDHSEELGNAFEYLLSVLGSQGDAGQFRTPRHIIDFMVEVIDPHKHETILDPACGTAGFLISAFKHIRKHNSSNFKPDGHHKDALGESAPELILADSALYSGDRLTPDERKKLTENIQGYDISPDMVRLSLVNLYLHGFPNPRIQEYDTLTSEKNWDESFDVILANPPFMTPKGGIRPHRRFQVQAKRSEVLFVDYILEHLNPNGRAAVIVPEGIIFKSENAYKSLRRLLLDDGLYAVVSLPPGVFNPYSGVKTSILFFDMQLGKRAAELLFVKIEQDGFDLGAQRRRIDRNDLPEALRVLRAWQRGEKMESPLALWAEKTGVAADGDYNLSAERYRISQIITNKNFDLIQLKEAIEIDFGTRITKREDSGTEYPVFGGGGESFRTNSFNRSHELVISRFAMSEECVRFVNGKFFLLDSGFTYHIKLDKESTLTKNFLDLVLLSKQKEIYQCSRGHAQRNLEISKFLEIQIPFPPLEVQRDIVEQIQVKQDAIDAARALIASLEKERRFFARELQDREDVQWVELGEVCDINPESATPISKFGSGTFTYIDISSINNNSGEVNFNNVLNVNDAPSRARWIVRNDDVLISTVRPNLRAFVKLENIPERTFASTGFAVLRVKRSIYPDYLFHIIKTDLIVDQMISRMGKGSYPSINQNDVKQIKIPVISIDKQQELVFKLKEEDEFILANRKLINSMEKKIEQVLGAIF